MKYLHVELLYRINWKFKRDCGEAEPQFNKHTVAVSQIFIYNVLYIQGVSGGIINILVGGSMDSSK
jgi:hypothetical protein